MNCSFLHQLIFALIFRLSSSYSKTDKGWDTSWVWHTLSQDQIWDMFQAQALISCAHRPVRSFTFTINAYINFNFLFSFSQLFDWLTLPILSVIFRNDHLHGGGCGKSKWLIDLGSMLCLRYVFDFSLPVILMFCFCLPDCSCADLRPRSQWFHASLTSSLPNRWEDSSTTMLPSFVWGAWPVYPIITN